MGHKDSRISSEWIDRLVGGSFQSELLDVRISRPGFGPYLGCGVLQWQDAPDGIKVEANTPSDINLMRVWLASGPPPGKLFAEEDFWSVRARTPEQVEVSADWLLQNGELSGPSVRWVLHPKRVTLTFREESSLSRFLGVIRLEDRHIWTRCTPDLRQCSQSCAVHYTYCLPVQSKYASIRLLEGPGSLGIVEIIPSENAAAGLETVARCFLTALGFLFGHFIQFLGYEWSNGQVRQHVLFSRAGERENQWYKPLQPPWVARKALSVESLLARAVDYLVENGENCLLAAILSTCWNVADCFITSRALVAAVLLERLAREAWNALDRPPGLANLRKDIDLVSRMLSENPDQFASENFVARACGMLGAMKSPQCREMLYHIRDEGGVSIRDDEVEAWDSIRNRLAHGNFADWVTVRYPLQHAVDDCSRVAGTINKLALYLFGYEGPYIEYSESGWPEKDFQPSYRPGARVKSPD